MVTQEQVKDITDRAEALYTYLDIERKKIEFEEEDLRTQASDFWDDPEQAREVGAQTMDEVRKAMRIDYFNDAELIRQQAERFANK